MKFASLPKLQPGDSVAIVSPSFVAPAVFPLEYDLGLSRLRERFGLNPVELPHVKDGNATPQEKMDDLIQAFSDPEIKGVITTLGGDHQIEYVHKLPAEPFRNNPKPFFGYSDNTHFSNFLFLQGIPSYYGGCIYTEYAMQGAMHPLTERYTRTALFSGGEQTLEASPDFNDEDLMWGLPENHTRHRRHQPNEGWHWDGARDGRGVLWGGCVESVDEILRHGRANPSLSDFEKIVLFLETSEEMPCATYVGRVLRAFGERDILSRVQGVLVGRPKAWNFEKRSSEEEKVAYKEAQRHTVLETIRKYNPTVPVVQNMDFGHTSPTLCLPYGGEAHIQSGPRTVRAWY
jgi:muramoyltetrapeptide carboxypeptidase LdcA involved in peptidoglycan recycling